MKITQITEKSPKELTAFVEEQRLAVAELVRDMRTKKVSNVKQIASHKRDIARALTITRQREITEMEKTNE